MGISLVKDEVENTIAAVGMRETRARRKVMALEIMGKKCSQCGWTHIASLRIAYKGTSRILPDQLTAYRKILSSSQHDKEFRILCLNCLADERHTALVNGQSAITREYDEQALVRFQKRCLKTLEVAILPIWDGSTPLTSIEIYNALKKAEPLFIRSMKTLYKELQHLASTGYVASQKDPADMRRRLYTVLKRE